MKINEHLYKEKIALEDAFGKGILSPEDYIEDRAVLATSPKIKENSKPYDPGKHYRNILELPLTTEEIVNRKAKVKLDPAYIACAYPMSPMRFTILKKVLRCGTGNKTYEEDLQDIISAAERELVLHKQGLVP